MSIKEAKKFGSREYSEAELLMIKLALFAKMNEWLNNNPATKRMEEKMGKIGDKLAESGQRMVGRHL